MKKIYKNPIVIGLSTIIAIIIGMYTIQDYIEREIRRITSEEEFVMKVVMKIRPSAIFNSNGSILSNQGAMEYIDEINIVQSKSRKGNNYPNQIIITPNQFLSEAPLVTIIGNEHFEISTQRGDKFDWIFNLKPIIWNDENVIRKYRVEVLF